MINSQNHESRLKISLSGYSVPWKSTRISEKDCKRITIRVNKETWTTFENKYTALLSAFLRRCILRAIRSKEFFDDVYFHTEEI